ncbi:MAG: sugar phosphate isomerase/epimerase, partial [Verrucomicrobiae bacterium]|nr:sugar phosphate isomerase/epimerase [Verrucomicrobiae bacterium]
RQYQRSLDALHRCARVAEKHKVTLCLENVWNKFLLSPLEMREFIDKLGSDCVGAYFDVGNVVLYGYPQDWIRTLGKRIVRVHIKDFKPVIGNINGFCNLLDGDVNWKAVMAELRALRYDGLCTVEVPAYRQSPEGCLRDWSSKLDQIFAL